MFKRIIRAAVVPLLALGGMVAVAAPASAHVGQVTPKCDSLTVNLTKYQVTKHKKNEVFVQIDNKVVENNTKFEASFSKTYSFDPYVAHEYKVRVHAQDDPNGSKGWSFTKKGTTTPCEREIPDKPSKDDLVVVTESEPNCEDETVDVTTTTTVYTYTFDRETWTWVESSETSSVTVTREATAEECPPVVPEKPKPIVVEASSETIDCDTRTVTTTKTVTTTDWVLVDHEWVKAEPVTVETVTTRDATTKECPVTTTPPTTQPPVTTPPAPVPSDDVTPAARRQPAGELAHTGAQAGMLTGLAVLLAALGGGLVFGTRRRGQHS